MLTRFGSGWINLPLSAIGLVLTIFFLRLKQLKQPLSQKLQRLDWIGLVLFMASCTLFASPIAWAGAMFPWASYQTLIPLLLGSSLLILFALFESVIGSVIVEIVRTYRATILVSWVFVAVGAGVMTLLDRGSSLAEKESFQVLLGLGLGPF